MVDRHAQHTVVEEWRARARMHAVSASDWNAPSRTTWARPHRARLSYNYGSRHSKLLRFRWNCGTPQTDKPDRSGSL